jgi:hypothetical protein
MIAASREKAYLGMAIRASAYDGSLAINDATAAELRIRYQSSRLPEILIF